MQNLQNHIRNYELVERKCNELFEFLLVDDQKLSITTSGNLLVHIVQCIESLAKDLHKELAPLFPKLPKFHAGEQFDYDALGFLDQALGLSKKQIKITSKLMPYLSEEKRLITPLRGAHESNDKHPHWSKAYQTVAPKHNALGHTDHQAFRRGYPDRQLLHHPYQRRRVRRPSQRSLHLLRLSCLS